MSLLFSAVAAPSFAPTPLAGNAAVHARSSASMMARKVSGATKADLIVLAAEQQLPMVSGRWKRAPGAG